MTDNPYFVKLKNRGLVRISGVDRHTFLQGLITNDIRKLETTPSIYACLLTAQGKFLHDFFIHAIGDELWLDCEGGERALDLGQKLNMYKLRSNVIIEAFDENEVYAVFDADHGTPDPRHFHIGARSFERPEIEERGFEEWDRLRITLCIPDGSRDMVIGQSTMLECRIDYLNGVDFDKGCYVGQELTARMHYRGLAKKHLYAVQGELPDGDIRNKDGVLIGEMRSRCGNIGIALLKDEFAKDLKDKNDQIRLLG